MENKCGARIKERLSDLNMTQADLCRATGINSATMSQYVSGKYFPAQDRLEILAEALRTTPAYLMGWEDSITVPLYEAAAGEGRINDGYPSETYSIALDPDQIIFDVHGRSMEPTLLDGDKVVITPQSVIDYQRQIALVKIDGEADTLKRVEVKSNGILLIGDNVNEFPPRFFSEKEVEEIPVLIEGVVVKLIREL